MSDPISEAREEFAREVFDGIEEKDIGKRDPNENVSNSTEIPEVERVREKALRDHYIPLKDKVEQERRDRFDEVFFERNGETLKVDDRDTEDKLKKLRKEVAGGDNTALNEGHTKPSETPQTPKK